MWCQLVPRERASPSTTHPESTTQWQIPLILIDLARSSRGYAADRRRASRRRTRIDTVERGRPRDGRATLRPPGPPTGEGQVLPRSRDRRAEHGSLLHVKGLLMTSDA